MDRSEVRLEPRRVYILPTRSGLLYGLAIITLLVSSMNFSNNMGFALTFLLTAVAVVSMHHCQRNLVGLTLSMGQPESGFAGAQVGFRVRVQNPLADWRMQIRIGWDQQPGKRVPAATGRQPNDLPAAGCTPPGADQGAAHPDFIRFSAGAVSRMELAAHGFRGMCMAKPGLCGDSDEHE